MKRSGFKFRPRRNKYGAIKTKVDGIVFDSMLEASWYQVLKLMEAGGLIRDLELQREFILSVEGKQICIYIADYFFFDTKLGRWVVGDAKGVQTDVFKLKWKLMAALYPQHSYQIYKGKPYVR